MDKLPQELVDEIIGSVNPNASGGWFDLLACSLVSRSWRKQAQKGLFSSVAFTDQGLLQKWYRVIAQDSELPSYVRYLYWKIPYRADFFEFELPGSFISFSDLQYLSISRLSLQALDNATIKRIFGPLGHSLRTLEIFDLTASPEKWCLLVSLLPHLQSLAINCVHTEEEEPAPGMDDPPSFNFAGHIGFCAPSTVRFFRWIARSRPRLRGITVAGNEIDSVVIETLNLVVKSCSATLTTIILDPTSIRQNKAVEILEELDLSPCRNLHTLIIRPSISRPAALHALLNKISSKHFEKLAMGPDVYSLPGSLGKYDQVFYSFAGRLRELGAVKPLTIVVGLERKGESGVPYFQRMWPLFSSVGAVVPGYDWYR